VVDSLSLSETPAKQIDGSSSPQASAIDLSAQPLVNLLGLLVNRDPKQRQIADSKTGAT
jgi:hypothetical protein